MDEATRTFRGIVYVEGQDIPNVDITDIHEIGLHLDNYINKRNGPLLLKHSNFIIGEGKSYNYGIIEVKGQTLTTIEINAEVYRDFRNEDEIWEGIRNNKYRGFSVGYYHYGNSLSGIFEISLTDIPRWFEWLIESLRKGECWKKKFDAVRNSYSFGMEFTGTTLVHKCHCCDSNFRSGDELLKHVDRIHLSSGFYLPPVTNNL